VARVIIGDKLPSSGQERFFVSSIGDKGELTSAYVAKPSGKGPSPGVTSLKSWPCSLPVATSPKSSGRGLKLNLPVVATPVRGLAGLCER
jgi:hypothetical protein